MKSVSDSNTLIGLAKGDIFPVLRELYERLSCRRLSGMRW